MEKKNIQLDSFDIPEEYVEGESMNVVEEFRRFIQNKIS